MDSPRGRLFFMRALADGRIEPSHTVKKHINLCLACRSCETACPSGVVYHSLLETAQQLLTEKVPASFFERFVRSLLLRKIFPYKKRLRFMFRLLWLYQRSGIQKLIRAARLIKLFSKQLEMAERFLPRIVNFCQIRSSRALKDSQKPVAGLLRGCITDYFAPEINRATLNLIEACGYSVFIPDAQHCCGAVHLHNQEFSLARNCARSIITIFEMEPVDYIITNTAGCGAMMKEYKNLLADDAEYGEKAKQFSAKVRDITEFLVDYKEKLPLRALEKCIVYDDPCHLIHGQKIQTQPRELLSAVPGLTIRHLVEADICCGSGGTFNVTQPELSLQVLKRKMNYIRQSRADIVVTANIGCIIQLKRGTELEKMPLEVSHIVNILDEALIANNKND